MAGITTIGYAPDTTSYEGLLAAAAASKPGLFATPSLPDNGFDDNIEPLLRVQEHIQSTYGSHSSLKEEWHSSSAGTGHADSHLLSEQTFNGAGSEVKGSTLAEQYLHSQFETSSPYLGESKDVYNISVPTLLSSMRDTRSDFGACTSSDPPYDPSLESSSLAVLTAEDATEKHISPAVDSNLSLSPDIPVIGSGAGSVQSPEPQPYEYHKGGAANMFAPDAYTPLVVPPSTKPEEYDEGRFPNFNSMRNGYYNDCAFMDHIGKSGATFETNTWQEAMMSAAYADATRAAVFRSLVEASYHPRSPDLYDSLGRSLTGQGNLEFDPMYGVFRNTVTSQTPSPLGSSPNNMTLIGGSPAMDSRASHVRSVRNRRPKVANGSSSDFETKVLPRPSFAGTSSAGGSFMMVNLRAKKPGQRKRPAANSTGVNKRPIGARPKPL